MPRVNWAGNSVGEHLAADRRGSPGGVAAGMQVSNGGGGNPVLSSAVHQ